MPLVFVYGTLKRAGRLARVMKDEEFISEAITTRESFDLFPGGSYPYLWNGKHRIAGELYNVSDETLEQLDYIEGVPRHYQRVSLDVEYGGNFYSKAIAYMAAKDFNFIPKESDRVKYNKETNTKEWLCV